MVCNVNIACRNIKPEKLCVHECGFWWHEDGNTIFPDRVTVKEPIPYVGIGSTPSPLFSSVCISRHYRLLKGRTYSRLGSALQRPNIENSKETFPEKKLCGHSPIFHMHVSVSDFYISTIDLPILLQENMWTNPGNIKIAYRHMNVGMWKLGLRLRNSFSGNT